MGTVKHSPCDEPCTDVRQTPHIITRPPNGRQLPYLLPLAAVFLSLGISAYFAATPRTPCVTPYHPALDFCLLCALACARYRTSRMGTVKHSPCDEPCTDVRQTPHIITRPPNGRQLPYLLPMAAVLLSLGISAYFAATPRTPIVTPYHPALGICLLCALGSCAPSNIPYGRDQMLAMRRAMHGCSSNGTQHYASAMLQHTAVIYWHSLAVIRIPLSPLKNFCYSAEPRCCAATWTAACGYLQSCSCVPQGGLHLEVTPF